MKEDDQNVMTFDDHQYESESEDLSLIEKDEFRYQRSISNV